MGSVSPVSHRRGLPARRAHALRDLRQERLVPHDPSRGIRPVSRPRGRRLTARAMLRREGPMLVLMMLACKPPIDTDVPDTDVEDTDDTDVIDTDPPELVAP